MIRGRIFVIEYAHEVRQMKNKEKNKYSIWQNVRYMVKLAWSHHKSVVWMCFLWAGLSLGIAVVQLFIAPMVLEKVEAAAPLGELLGTIGIFAAALVVLSGILGYVEENIIYGRISVRTIIISLINRKACTTSYPNTRDPDVLKLHEKTLQLCSGNREPTENIWVTMSQILLNVSGFALYLTLLSDLDLFLILVVTVTTATGFFVSKRINEWGYRHKEEEAGYRKQLSYFNNKAKSIKMAKDIRIFGLSDWLVGLFKSVQALHEAYLDRRERVYSWTCVVDVVLQFLRNGIAYLYLLRMALEGGLSAAEFLLYFSAFTGFSQWVTGILEQVTQLHKESLGISTVREYLEREEQFRFEGGIPIPQAESYELKLEDVTFRYPGTDRQIVRHMDLTLRPGEKVAIVGLNGAGKTTLVKLLCGFYDPDEGRVTLNGIDIREFDRHEYYKLFSAVFQEFSELDITVAQSVAQKVDGFDMDRVKECIGKAGLTEFIEKLPQGYDSHLGKHVYNDGIQLSGGQTQRMMLARALYKDGPFLVLDEPTAALDPIAEHDIYTKYNEMTQGKSSLFISHRLASTRFCDRILFLQDGVVAEEGTHDELMRHGGGYAKLFHVQARYYQEGREHDGEEN